MGNHTRPSKLEPNKDAAKKFLLSEPVPFSLPGFENQEDVRVMKSVTNTEIQFIISKDDTPTTILAIQQKNDTDIAELMDMTIFNLYDTPRGVEDKCYIFNCLNAVLSSYPVRISHDRMKKQGILSWGGLVAWATRKGFYVYLIDNMANPKKSDNTQIKQCITDGHEWSEKNRHFFYRGQGELKNFQVIISQKTLD